MSHRSTRTAPILLLASLLLAATPAAAQVWAQGRARIVSPTPTAGAHGSAVAVLDWDGDGDLEVAVGDRGQKGTAPPNPTVRIYARVGAGWQELDSWSVDTASGGGAALAVGDFDENGRDDLLIGAPDAGSGAGTLYWWRSFEEGSSHGPIAAVTAIVGGGCGTSLAVGDFDDDDHLDFAVGCPRASFDTFTDAGRVAILHGDGEGHFEAAVLFHQASSGVGGGPETGDLFGASLAVGDFFCDGIDDLAIGVPGEDVDGATNTGALHVLAGVAETGLTGEGSQLWHQGSTGMPGVSGDGDLFAAALAAGDFDRGLAGPFCDDLAIGIPDDADLEGGSVVVLFGDHDGLGTETYVHLGWPSFTHPSNPTPAHRLGHVLAAGRVDGDPADDLVIGAQGFEEFTPPPPLGPSASFPGIACVLYGDEELLFDFGSGICFSSSSEEFSGIGGLDPAFGAALAVGPFELPSGGGLVLGSPGNREAFVLGTALFADGFELGTERWSFDSED